MISWDVRLAAMVGRGQFHTFDLLRVLAAFGVLFSHVFLVTGRTGGTFGAAVLGLFAVRLFFVISGFLVAKSWVSSGRFTTFARNRVLRIFPGLAVVTLVSTFALGPLFTTLPLNAYFHDPATYRYLLSAALDNQRGLPGVFTENLHSGLLNGSLWTIPYEFAMYGVLAACGLITGRHFRWAILAIYMLMVTGCIFYLQFLSAPPQLRELEEHALDFGAYFFGGATIWCFREVVVLRGSLVALCCAALILRNALGIDAIVWNLALPYIAIWIGMQPAPGWTAHFQRNDYSYGLYIWAFPIQQAVVSLIGPGSFMLNLLLASAAAFAAAALSWHLVERPFLALKTRRRTTLRPPAQVREAPEALPDQDGAPR